MKLATVKDGTRDGTLVVVSRDLALAVPVPRPADAKAGDGEVVGAAAAVLRTVQVLATMVREVVLGHGSSWINRG